MEKHLVLTISIFILAFVIESRAEPQVNISDGLLKGTTLLTRKGRNISAFMGIPYAEPPLGDLRFSSPIPAKKWNGTYTANKEGNECPQPVDGHVNGKEDCLYLNVFTPKLKFNELENNTLLPVMVWVHGGGFHVGSSGLRDYGPNYLMDRDIVFVSMNYRLGILGFLTTGDEVALGNFGLKDQNLALKWVQKNIHSFGGNPNRVTIFGESAGGASVSFHALSDKSDGLFHQYIAQSGSALVPWGFRNREDFKPDVNFIAKKVGCPIINSNLLVNCLRNTNYYTLVNLTTYDVLDFPEILWLPTNEVKSKDAFLIDTPENLINQNKLRDYPVMSGSVADEGLYLTAPFHANRTSRLIENVIKKCMNGTFNRFSSIKDLPKFNTVIKDYYFNGSISASKNRILKNFTKFAGDSEFVYPVAILAEKIAKFKKSPSYLYMFGYRGQTSYLSLEYGLQENIGVNHADDLLYILSGDHSRFISQTDNYVIDLMVDLWTSFAINGKPTSRQLAIPNLWEPYSLTKSYLQIGNIINNTEPCVTFQQDYLTDRMEFWKNNFPLIKV